MMSIDESATSHVVLALDLSWKYFEGDRAGVVRTRLKGGNIELVRQAVYFAHSAQSLARPVVESTDVAECLDGDHIQVAQNFHLYSPEARAAVRRRQSQRPAEVRLFDLFKLFRLKRSFVVTK